MKPGAFDSRDEGSLSLCVRTLRGSPPKWNLEPPQRKSRPRQHSPQNACKLNVNRSIDSQEQRNAFCVINCERDVVGLHLITSLGKIYHDRLKGRVKKYLFGIREKGSSMRPKCCMYIISPIQSAKEAEPCMIFLIHSLLPTRSPRSAALSEINGDSRLSVSVARPAALAKSSRSRTARHMPSKKKSLLLPVSISFTQPDFPHASCLSFDQYRPL